MKTVHEQYADSLRAIADWYEAHPEIPLPGDDTLTNYAVCTREHAESLIRGLGNCKKDYDETSFTISRRFGVLNVRFYFSRSEVCKKVVVGSRIEPEQIVPARVIPAHTVDVVEWECMPVMSLKQIEEVSAPQIEAPYEI
jgi:hypothetical protein